MKHFKKMLALSVMLFFMCLIPVNVVNADPIPDIVNTPEEVVMGNEYVFTLTGFTGHEYTVTMPTSGRLTLDITTDQKIEVYINYYNSVNIYRMNICNIALEPGTHSVPVELLAGQYRIYINNDCSSEYWWGEDVSTFISNNKVVMKYTPSGEAVSEAYEYEFPEKVDGLFDDIKYEEDPLNYMLGQTVNAHIAYDEHYDAYQFTIGKNGFYCLKANATNMYFNDLFWDKSDFSGDGKFTPYVRAFINDAKGNCVKELYVLSDCYVYLTKGTYTMLIDGRYIAKNYDYNKGHMYLGAYSFSLNKASKIPSTTIKKVKNKKRCVLEVTCNKKGFADGYQVQIALNKKFKKGKQTSIIKSYNPKLVTKFYGLKKNKKYYVRVRTYIEQDGKKYYSKWSKVKTVKIKK